MDKVTVSADALRSVLAALTGPPHLIRELMVIHSLHQKMPDTDGSDSVGTLINEYNEALEDYNESIEKEPRQS